MYRVTMTSCEKTRVKSNRPNPRNRRTRLRKSLLKRYRGCSSLLLRVLSPFYVKQVAQDMTNILKDLKDHLPALKSGKDSFSDVVPKLEESFLKRNKKVDDKGKSSKKGKPQTSCGPRNNSNACARSGNKGSKTNAVPNPKLQNITRKARPSTADRSKKDGGGSIVSAPRPQNRPMSANNSSAATNRARPQ